jgi:hypothetical protein
VRNAEFETKNKRWKEEAKESKYKKYTPQHSSAFGTQRHQEQRRREQEIAEK